MKHVKQDEFDKAWQELKNEARHHWNKLTSTDLNKINGSREELVSLLHKTYGYTKEKADREIDSFLHSQSNLLGHTAVGDSIRKAGEKINDLSEDVAKKSDKIVLQGKEATSQFQEEIEEYYDKVFNYVRKNPVKSALIAGGIGLLLGRLFKK